MNGENQIVPAASRQPNIQNTLNALGSENEQSGFMQKLLKNTELFSIVLDMLGSRADPGNPFAGVGSALAKSSLASKAETERTGKFDQMVSGLLGQMTGADKAGPTALTITGDPNVGYQYNVKGYEAGQQKLKEASAPVIRSSEDFIKDFGGGI